MNVKHAMILAAGLGTRMRPLTLDTPKPLIRVGSKNLLERSINLLEKHGIEKIIINIHHLGDQIEKFILNIKSKIKIDISNEKNLLLDTGGGVKEGTKTFDENPFFVFPYLCSLQVEFLLFFPCVHILLKPFLKFL